MQLYLLLSYNFTEQFLQICSVLQEATNLKHLPKILFTNNYWSLLLTIFRYLYIVAFLSICVMFVKCPRFLGTYLALQLKIIHLILRGSFHIHIHVQDTWVSPYAIPSAGNKSQATAFRLWSRHHLLILPSDHVRGDGWSLKIMLKSLWSHRPPRTCIEGREH